MMERKVVEAHGGTNAPNANTEDKATQWLDQNSAGAGAFTLVGWTRNAQILLTRNPHYWRGPAHFEHVVIRHMGDSATQLLAVKRGDIDAAFNLIPEQVATLKGDPNVRVEGLESLDFVYMALTCEPDFNKALAVKEARQAVWYAIDYDGIINSMLGGTGDPLRQLHPDRPVRLDRARPPSSSAITRTWIERSSCCRRRASRRVRVQAELWRCRGVRAVVCGAGAEAAVRPGARRHQGDAGSDGSGEPAHAVHHRQIDRAC